MEDAPNPAARQPIRPQLLTGGGLVVLAVSVFLLKPFGGLIFLAVFATGYAILLKANPGLIKTNRMPRGVFGARRSLRRLAALGAHALLAAALVSQFLGNGLMPVLLILGIIVFNLGLGPYQAWTLGADRLDEYHTARRRWARDVSYTALLVLMVAGFVVLAMAPVTLTPGQFAVLYDGDRCLGGGVIEQTMAQ